MEPVLRLLVQVVCIVLWSVVNTKKSARHCLQDQAIFVFPLDTTSSWLRNRFLQLHYLLMALACQPATLINLFPV